MKDTFNFLLTINPELYDMENTAIWKDSAHFQKIFCDVIQRKMHISYICSDLVDTQSILGRKVITPKELIELENYGLIMSIVDFENVLTRHPEINKERVYVWTRSDDETIYI